MLGFADPWVGVVYLLCIASTALCVIYGLVNWNKGEEPMRQEDLDWAKEEKDEVEEGA